MSKDFFESLGKDKVKVSKPIEVVDKPFRVIKPLPEKEDVEVIEVPKVVKAKVTKPRAPRQPKIDQKALEKFTNDITQSIKKELLETKSMIEDLKLTNEIKNSELIDQLSVNLQLKNQLDRFIYSEDNLLRAIWRRVSVKSEWKKSRRPQGIKASNLLPRFGEQVTITEIQDDLFRLHNDGFLSKNTNGWYNFSTKGKELLKDKEIILL